MLAKQTQGSGFGPQHCEEQKPTRLDDSRPALCVGPTVCFADSWDVSTTPCLSASEHELFPCFLPLCTVTVTSLECYLWSRLWLSCWKAGACIWEGQDRVVSTHWLRSAGFSVRLHGVLGHVDDLCLFPHQSNCFTTQRSGAQAVPRGPV